MAACRVTNSFGEDQRHTTGPLTKNVMSTDNELLDYFFTSKQLNYWHFVEIMDALTSAPAAIPFFKFKPLEQASKLRVDSLVWTFKVAIRKRSLDAF